MRHGHTTKKTIKFYVANATRNFPNETMEELTEKLKLIELTENRIIINLTEKRERIKEAKRIKKLEEKKRIEKIYLTEVLKTTYDETILMNDEDYEKAKQYYEKKQIEELRIRQSKAAQGISTSNKKHKYVGLHYFPNLQRPFVSTIRYNGKGFHLGSFRIEEHAAMAYDQKAMELFGPEARRNFPHLTTIRNDIL